MTDPQIEQLQAAGITGALLEQLKAEPKACTGNALLDFGWKTYRESRSGVDRLTARTYFQHYALAARMTFLVRALQGITDDQLVLLTGLQAVLTVLGSQGNETIFGAPTRFHDDFEGVPFALLDSFYFQGFSVQPDADNGQPVVVLERPEFGSLRLPATEVISYLQLAEAGANAIRDAGGAEAAMAAAPAVPSAIEEAAERVFLAQMHFGVALVAYAAGVPGLVNIRVRSLPFRQPPAERKQEVLSAWLGFINSTFERLEQLGALCGMKAADTV